MDSRHLELAAEFCVLVRKSNLIEYLKLDAGVQAEEAREKLKKRRKYMQGMQSNPKYKKEALFLIKHFTALDALMSEPDAYLGEASRQAESQHLPVLEMTINGVLKGGTLTGEQEEYLRRNALEMGVTESTFEATLDRLSQEAGVARPGRAAPEPTSEITDHYGVLGIEADADRDQVYEAYRSRYREARNVKDKAQAESLYREIDKAWQVLSDPHTREQYDLSLRSTGPPARDREVGSPKALPSDRTAPTAPPVRERVGGPTGTSSPGADDRASSPKPPPVPVQALSAGTLPLSNRQARLEILGDPIRHVPIGNDPVTTTIHLRNAGGDPMPGRVSTDESWLTASPARLHPNMPEQSITVRIDPTRLTGNSGTGVVTIQTDRGDRASIVFEVRRGMSSATKMAIGAAVTVFFALLLIVVIAIGGMGGRGGDAPGLHLNVDPTAQEVLLNGVLIGSGSAIVVPQPPNGAVALEIVQPNFKTYKDTLQIEPGESKQVTIKLELDSRLDFVPRDDLQLAPVDEAYVQRVMRPRTAGMDECIRTVLTGRGTLSGTVRIHIGPDGRSVGVEMEGSGTEEASVKDCLKRQAAAVVIHPLKDGDYATVRYDYQVAEAAP